MTAALLTTTLLWAVGLLLYGLLLRPVAAHAFNRAYLLALTVLGLGLPWLPVARPELPLVPVFDPAPAVWLDEVVVTAAGGGAWPELPLLPTVYLVGLAVALGLAARRIAGVVRCFGESRPLPHVQAGGMRVRETPLAVGPFGFGRTLFVAEWASLAPADRARLVRHEVEHWRRGHLVDNLLSGLACALAWFHPLAYVLRRELRLVHEYQADRATVTHFDLRAYRRQLLGQQLHPRLPSLVAAFAHQPLQNRFDMMTRSFRPAQTWRLPLAACGLAAVTLACSKESITDEDLAQLAAAQDEGPEAEAELAAMISSGEYTITRDTIISIHPDTYEEEMEIVLLVRDGEGDVVRSFKASAEAPNDGEAHEESAVAELVRGQEVFRIVEEMPYFRGAGCGKDKACNEKAMLQHLYSSVRYPDEVRDDGVEGKVIAEFVVGTDGAILSPRIVRSPHPALSAEVLRVLSEMPEWVPGRQRGQDVQVSFVLPVQFRME